MWTMQRKARRASVPLFSGPGRHFLLNCMPPMLVGGVLTAALYRAGSWHAIPGMWLLLYGTAVVSGGAFSVRIVPAMGICFMVLGGLALLAPSAWENWFMLAGFCGLHLVFGYLIARRHGG
jgi:heme/copper-type cytochrome/quinol oxidase subunit 3